MKRLIVSVVLAGVAVAGTACNVRPAAARVDGTVIPHSALTAQLQALANTSNPAARCAVEILTGAPVQSAGAGQETVPLSLVDSELGTLVQDVAEGHALAQRHITVTAADLTAAHQDFLTDLQEGYLQVSQTGGSLSTACRGVPVNQVISNLPRVFTTHEVQMLARQEQLQSLFGKVSITPGALQRYYSTHTVNFTQVCLNLIVADGLPQAQLLRAAVTTGTSFAVAASSAAADVANTPPGGQLRCVYPNQITSTFGTAAASVLDNLATGAVSQPVAVSSSSPTGGTTTFYLVAQMRQRHLVPLGTALQSQLRLALLQQGNTAATAGIGKILAKASVWINPRYGSWSKVKQQILPPPSPRCNVLLNTAVSGTCSSSTASGAGIGSLGSLGTPGG